MVRAKFRLEEKTYYPNGGKLVFQPVVDGSQENKEFFKYTPSGKIEMQVVSDKVLDMMKPGEEYYIDFTPASEPVES
jgi:antitoxin component YwqK of YwqJK toxin-antitoxin module